jgi:hypothetical protein
LANSFPWLSKIATRFQEYEFKGLIYHYVPTSGTFNGTSAALGSVMLQTTYRATDAAPTSKLEMLNEYCSNETVPFETMAHPIECDPKENPFAIHYIRTGTPGTSDPLLYDIGTTFVATQGMSTTDVVGDLWCTYEVELKKPLISSPVVSEPSYFGSSWANPSTTSFFSGTQGSIVGSLPVTATGRTITLPARTGYYIVTFSIRTSGVTAAATLGWSSGTLTFVNCGYVAFDGSVDNYRTVVTGTNPVSDQISWVFGVYVADSTLPATVEMPTAVWTSGSTIRTSLAVMGAGH